MNCGRQYLQIKDEKHDYYYSKSEYKGWKNRARYWKLIGDKWIAIERWRHERWIEKNKKLYAKRKKQHESGKSKICYNCYLRDGKSKIYRFKKKCNKCKTELVSTLKFNEYILPMYDKYNNFMYRGLNIYYQVDKKDVKVEFFRQELVKLENS